MTFKKLFSAPVFDDEIKTQQAYMLHIVLWTLICVPIPYVIYSLVLTDNFSRALLQASFGEIVNIILLIMLHRGHVKAASIIQVSAFWFFFTATAITGNGVQGEAYLLGYGLAIAIAGILLGKNGASVLTFLSLTAGGWMVYGQLQGRPNSGFDNSPLTTWVVSLVLFPVGVMLQHLASHATKIALSRAQASEEKYRLISQVSSDYTFASEVHKDGSANLSWVAGAFTKMTGYTFEEYVASGGWLGHVHPDDLEKDTQDMEKLLKNHDIKSEIRTFTKNGELRWEQIFAHPIWDEKENRLTGIFGAVRDITEQKGAEAALAHERDLLQIFMDNIPDQVYFKDAESRFVRINQAQARFLGIEDPDDAIGKTDLDFQDSELAREFVAEEKQIVETGRSISDRVEFNPTADGKPRWLSATKVPVRDLAGQIIGTIGVSRDITQQKQAEAALAYERDLLQIFMDNIPDLIYFKDTESRFVRINQAEARFLGVDNPQDAIGKTDFDFQIPELAQEYKSVEKQIMETGESIISRVEFNPTESKKPRWLSSTKIPVIDSSRQITGIIGVSRDITEQKQAEAALAYERDILQIFMDNIPDQVYLKDTESRFIRVNQAQARFLGIDDPQDALGKTDLDFQPPELAQGFFAEEKQIIKTGQPIWNRIEFNPTEDGEPRWLSTTKVPAKNEWGQTIGTIGISRNITEMKKAEELEQKRRIMLEKVVKLGQNVTEVHDLRTTIEKIWQGVHDDLGFDRLGIYLYNPERNSMDGTFGTSIHGDMIDEWNTWVSLEQENLEARLFLRVLEDPNRTYLTHTYENDFNTPEGHIMSGVKDYAAIATSAGAKPVAVLCVDHVITGRPISEVQLEALRLFAGYAGLAIENARLNTALQNELSQHKETLLHQSAILNSIPDMAWLKDKNSRYVAVNEQFASTAGMKMEEITDKTDFDIWEKNLAEKYRSDDLDIIQSGQRKYHIEELQIDSAGREYWVETTKTPILNTDGEVIGTTGIAREITERKKAELERETLIAELEAKNAELERYTYTVSHDLKSPLVTIRGFLGYLEKDALAGNIQKVKDDIKRIESATQKMHALLYDLLELSRIGRLINQSTDALFTDIVKDAIDLVHGQIEAKNVLIEIHNTPVVVHGDRTRLTEVIQNLVDNAVKFMGNQAKPHIAIGTTTNEKNETIFFVRDNGVGIDTQYHERIFTLFNKLSADTEGTGIGLTLVRRIIEVHKGRIWLESEPGRGTTFYFTLNQD